MSTEASSLPDDPQVLKALVLQLQGNLRAHDLLVQALRLQIARLKRQKFGASSEKIAREIEQLELALEGLQIAQAELAPAPEPTTVDTASDPESPEEPVKAPRRRPRVSPGMRPLACGRHPDPGARPSEGRG